MLYHVASRWSWPEDCRAGREVSVPRVTPYRVCSRMGHRRFLPGHPPPALALRSRDPQAAAGSATGVAQPGRNGTVSLDVGSAACRVMPGPNWKDQEVPVHHVPAMIDRAVLLAFTAGATAAPALAQTPRQDWAAVDRAIGRPGSMQPGGVRKYSFPRSTSAPTIPSVTSTGT